MATAPAPLPSQLFQGMVFTCVGTLSVHHDEMERLVNIHGGEFKKSVTGAVKYLITNEKLFKEKHLKAFDKAKEHNCHVIKEEFIYDCDKQAKILPLDNYLLWAPSAEDLKRKRTTDSAASSQELQEAGAPDLKKREIEIPKPATDAEGQANLSKVGTDVTAPIPMPSEAAKLPETSTQAPTQLPQAEEEDETTLGEIVTTALEGPLLTEGTEAYYAMLDSVENFYEMKIVCPVIGGYVLETRFGKNGPGELQSLRNEKFDTKEKAIALFHKRFHNKTKNNWQDRFTFEKRTNYNYALDNQKLPQKKDIDAPALKEILQEKQITVPAPDAVPPLTPQVDKEGDLMASKQQKLPSEEAQMAQEQKHVVEATKDAQEMRMEAEKVAAAQPEKADLLKQGGETVTKIGEKLGNPADLAPKVETKV